LLTRVTVSLGDFAEVEVGGEGGRPGGGLAELSASLSSMRAGVSEV